MLPNKALQDKIEYVGEHWQIALFFTILAITVITFLLVVTGTRDCEFSTIKEGVKETCNCSGMELTVKSNTNAGEQKTICIGFISDKKTHQ